MYMRKNYTATNKENNLKNVNPGNQRYLIFLAMREAEYVVWYGCTEELDISIVTILKPYSKTNIC